MSESLPVPAEPAATAGEQLAGMLLGFVVSQAIYVAAVLGIADLLADGPRSVTALAAAAGADPDKLYRVLRLLAGHGIFTELPRGRFANSAHSQLLRETVPGSLRPLALAVGEGAYPALAGTRAMVQAGRPAFEVVFGAVWEEHLVRDPAARTRVGPWVAPRATAAADGLAAVSWRGTECVVEVGGAGALLVGLLRRRPGLRGVVFDQPQGVAEASERLQAAGLADRCRVVAGSFFQGVPSGGDAYVLASVLHAWEDPQAREILQAVRRVLPAHGRLLVVEEVLAAPNQPGGKVVDLLMAAVGGRERTWQEWRALLADSGFRIVQVRPGPTASILEARPSRRPAPPSAWRWHLRWARKTVLYGRQPVLDRLGQVPAPPGPGSTRARLVSCWPPRSARSPPGPGPADRRDRRQPAGPAGAAGGPKPPAAGRAAPLPARLPLTAWPGCS